MEGMSMGMRGCDTVAMRLGSRGFDIGRRCSPDWNYYHHMDLPLHFHHYLTAILIFIPRCLIRNHLHCVVGVVLSCSVAGISMSC